MLRVVTAYTPDYTAFAHRLIESCQYFDVPITAYSFASRGDWKRNCAVKPEMILRAMNETGDDCIWLDADMYLRAWPESFPPGDVLLRFSDPPEAQVFDFELRRNVPNTHTQLTPWGGHMLWRVKKPLIVWAKVCQQYGTVTNDEQCLMQALRLYQAAGRALIIGPFDPWFIIHTPEGHKHGKPSAAEGWI